MTQPRILAFAGSVRRQSFNRRLVSLAAELVKGAGGQVTLIDLKDYPLPLFDQDLEQEQGHPENMKKLKQLFLDHDGLLIASPEYNSSITPLLKNTIDWVSRQAEGEPPLSAYRGKVAALVSASPGALGGLRGLVHLRSILGNIGVIVLPGQLAIPRAHEAFNEEGTLKDAKMQTQLEGIAKALTSTVGKLTSS